MGIRRTSRRVSKYEAIDQQRKLVEYRTKGSGLFIYRNKSTFATLQLPKPAENGQKVIQPRGEWQGDDYYMQLVRTNEATLVRTITSPQEEKDIKMKDIQEKKLILDQPDQITSEGTVEHVMTPNQPMPLHENPQTQNKNDILINEDPVDGVEIII